MKIAIIGTGFLGTKILEFFSEKHKTVGTYFEKKEKGLHYLDATKFEDVEDFLLKHRPDVVIDTIGLSNYSICEKNPELAEKINYLTAKNISKVSKLINAKMIFISSIYVFDGKKGEYTEEDLPNPINVYGKTKIMAEEEVLKIKDSIILRIDILYGYNGKDEDNGLIDELFPKKEIEVRNPEQIRHPILTDDVARIIEFLVEKKESGIFNAASKEKIKKYDFLKTLAESLNEKCKILIPQTENSNLIFPNTSTFNTSKIENLGIKTHTLKEGIEIIKKQIS